MSFNSNLLAQVYQGSFTQLTPREFDLISALEKGMSTEQIATTLFISQATVKTHLASIYRKLDVTNRNAAVHAAKKLGLTS
jgi:DNA-binding NarL/FixJ family response regulator